MIITPTTQVKPTYFNIMKCFVSAPLSKSELLVYLMFAYCASPQKKGYACPGATLAKNLFNMRKDTFLTTTDRLIETGYLIPNGKIKSGYYRSKECKVMT
jgi:hypothetical protein